MGFFSLPVTASYKSSPWGLQTCMHVLDLGDVLLYDIESKNLIDLIIR